MRIFLLSLLLFFSGLSTASTLTYWSGGNGTRGGDPLSACKARWSGSEFIDGLTENKANCKKAPATFYGAVYIMSENCQFGDNGSICNASCDAPGAMVDGQCVRPQTCDQNWSGGEKVWSASQGACVKYPNLSAPEFCAWSAGKSRGRPACP